MTLISEVAPSSTADERADDAAVERRTVPTAVVVAVVLLGALTVLAILEPWLPFADPLRADPRNTSQGPSLDHWFGTDTIGRDVFSRCIAGSRISLLIGVASALAAALAGTVLGLVAGFVRGRTEAALVSLMDAMLAFPSLVLVLALTAFLGASSRNVIMAIAIVFTPVVGRLVRAQTLTFSARDFVLAAQAGGATRRRILLTEIFPNVAPAVAAYTILLAAIAIVVEGTLSFLGLGVPLPTPTWGSIISGGQGQLESSPHIFLFPVAMIFATVFALNTVGDHLRSRFVAPHGHR